MNLFFFHDISESKIPINASIAIYGAGELGSMLYEKIREVRSDIKIVAFTDTYKKGKIFNLDIVDSKEFYKRNNDIITVIASIYWEEIVSNIEIFSPIYVFAPSYSDIYCKCLTQFRDDLDLKAISVREEINCRKFKYFLEKEKPSIVLEIGTNRGISSAFIANYCDIVVTVDIFDFKIKHDIWKSLNVDKKIIFYHINDNDAKKYIVDKYDFDLAFIDGDHSYEGVSHDFEITRKIGKIIFHDYGYFELFDKNAIDLEKIKKFCDTLPVQYEDSVLELRNPFALWKSLSD